MSVCPGDDEAARKGQLLTLLAEQALQCLDFKASYIHCRELLAAGRQMTLENFVIPLSPTWLYPALKCTAACKKKKRKS